MNCVNYAAEQSQETCPKRSSVLNSSEKRVPGWPQFCEGSGSTRHFLLGVEPELFRY